MIELMAIRLDFDPIEFLLRRRFGSGETPFPNALLRGQSWPSPKDEQERLRKREAYAKELGELSPDELNELVRSAYAEDTAKREAEFPFNKPQALATPQTYDYWAKAAYWTEDEAVALLIERNPTAMDWKRAEPVAGVSQTAGRFAQLRQLVLRAQAMQQLSRFTIPGLFLAWAQRNRIDVPEELEKAVRAHGIQVADWKTLYDEQKSRAESAETALLRLRQEVEEVARTATKKPLSTKERESILKMVIGMAIDGYGFDPKATRSPIPKEIADQLAARDLPLDQDTVRKYLKEAGELLPPQGEGDD